MPIDDFFVYAVIKFDGRIKYFRIDVRKIVGRPGRGWTMLLIGPMSIVAIPWIKESAKILFRYLKRFIERYDKWHRKKRYCGKNDHYADNPERPFFQSYQ